MFALYANTNVKRTEIDVNYDTNSLRSRMRRKISLNQKSLNQIKRSINTSKDDIRELGNTSWQIKNEEKLDILDDVYDGLKLNAMHSYYQSQLFIQQRGMIEFECLKT